MADKPPLIFEKRMGALWPASQAATDALHAVEGRCRVEIKRTRGNSRRNALYWACLNLAAPMLSEKVEGDAIDAKLLHNILKDRRGLVRIIKLPSGQEFRDYESTSFAKMAEPDRAEFITWALATVSKWIGVPVETLKQECGE